jgi:hypothetical protein
MDIPDTPKDVKKDPYCPVSFLHQPIYNADDL